MSKTIVVFGSTGAQGGSVARALNKDKQYHVKAVTRDVTSNKAKELESLGIELVQADLDKADTLQKALEGAYGVFLVTNFWEHKNQEKEVKQAQLVIDTAKSAGVLHLVFSGLEHVKKITGQDCPHFDGKGKVEEYLEAQGIPFTSVRYSYYYNNIVMFMPPRKDDKGEFWLDLPMGDVPMDQLCVHEAGECVHQVFNHPESYVGKKIGLSSDKMTISDFATLLTKEVGKTFHASPITTEAYAKLGFPGADDLAAMFHFYQVGHPDRDVGLTRKLNPSIPTLEQWIKSNKEAILAVCK